MAVMIILIVLMAVGGIGAVAWVLMNENQGNKTTQTSSGVIDEEGMLPISNGEEFLKKIGVPLAPKMVSNSLADNPYMPPVYSASKPALSPAVLSKEEDAMIAQEIHAATELQELKEKYNRLDGLFKEKSLELERVQNELGAELRTKKEFNKVKDILEKELKDVKDRAKEYKLEATNVQKDLDLLKEQMSELNEKNLKLERVVADKEDENTQLIKEAQKVPASKPAAVAPRLVMSGSILADKETTIEAPSVKLVENEVAVENAALNNAAQRFPEIKDAIDKFDKIVPEEIS